MTPRSVAPSPPFNPSTEVVKNEDIHKRRRRFIGPMPTAVLQSAEPKRPRKQKPSNRLLGRQDTETSSSSDSDDSSSLSDVIHRHALDFFLKHGGKRENWGESQQKSVRAEMRRRWRESEWGRARKRQRQTNNTPKWVGNSFDVGVFLGVDILDDNLPLVPEESQVGAGPSITAQTVRPTIGVSAVSDAADTFVTAPSHLNSLPEHNGPPTLSPDVSRDIGTVPSASSSTALLTPIIQSDDGDVHPPNPGPSTRPIPPSSHAAPLPTPSPVRGKGKATHVHYEDTPAPPAEVLARTGSEVKVTSAGAVEQTTSEARVKWGDVIMRGKRLVVEVVCMQLKPRRPHACPGFIHGRCCTGDV